MFRRPQYIALTVVLLVVVIFLALPSRTSQQIKVALGTLFLPLFGLASSSQQLADQTGISARSKRSLIAEIDALRRENDQLRLQSHQEEQLWQENERLRQAVNWRKQTPWKLKLAQVILRDPANWWRTVHIDLGMRDGVVTNLPVLTAEGLVGRVGEVGFSSSIVVLIGDPNCRVSALVEQGDRILPGRRPSTTISHGVITSGASSLLDPTIVNLTYLDRQSVIRPGLRVVTSGMGGIFPRGIPVGEVIGADSVGSGLYIEARVKLAANVANLSEVWVMLP